MSITASSQTGLINSEQLNLTSLNVRTTVEQLLANSTSSLISSSYEPTNLKENSSFYSSLKLDYKSANFTPSLNTSTLSTTENINFTAGLTTDNFSFDDEPTESSLTFYILIIILIIWNIYGLFIQIKLLFFTEPQIFNNQFFDNCTLTTSYFKYMINIKYTKLLNGYQINNGTIMIDFLDTKDRFVTRVTILPSWIVEKQQNSSKDLVKIIKFKFNRRFELPEIGAIRFITLLFYIS